MGKARKLTRREFLKGAGAAALGLALSNVVPRKMLSQASGCPEYRGIAPVDWDYSDRTVIPRRAEIREHWLDEIRELGANSVEITIPVMRGPDHQVGYPTEYPPYWEPWDSTVHDEGIKRYVRQAQERGFKVILDIPSLIGSRYPRPEPFDLDRFYANLETMALKWAEIAQELGVEGYCPEGEFTFEAALGTSCCFQRPDGYVSCHTPKAAAWIKQLIPKVRQRYSGKIIIQEDPYETPDIDYDGADYIGLHLHVKEGEYVPGQIVQRWRRYLRNRINAAHQAAQRDNCRVMITEASFGCIDTGLGCGYATSVNEQQQKELCEAFFQEAWGKTDGIFPCEWGDELEFRRQLAVTGKPAEEVVRRYYQSC